MLYEAKNLIPNSFRRQFGFIFSKSVNSNRTFAFKFLSLKASILYISIALLILVSKNLNGQSKFSDNLSLEVNYGIGYILPEYQFINYVVEDYAKNLEISLRKQTIGNTEWEQLYKYPAYGLRLIYSDLGSPDVLGKLYGAYPYYHITLANFNKLKLYNESGLGLSYVTKTFDLEDNFLNVAVGSHVNLHLNIRFGLAYQLSEKLSIRSALSFDHFSNANTQEPNLGINYITWNSSLSMALGTITERKAKPFSEKVKSVEKEIVYNIGGKHTRELSSKYYLTNSLSFELRKKYFRALHLGLGADLFYDTSVKDQLENKFKNSNAFQTGIHFAQSLVYNRFSFTLQQGVYLGLSEKVENNTIYNRGIVKYYVKENISVRLSMKSHLHILDYPEIGIGIKL